MSMSGVLTGLQGKTSSARLSLKRRFSFPHSLFRNGLAASERSRFQEIECPRVHDPMLAESHVVTGSRHQISLEIRNEPTRTSLKGASASRFVPKGDIRWRRPASDGGFHRLGMTSNAARRHRASLSKGTRSSRAPRWEKAEYCTEGRSPRLCRDPSAAGRRTRRFVGSMQNSLGPLPTGSETWRARRSDPRTAGRSSPVCMWPSWPKVASVATQSAGATAGSSLGGGGLTCRAFSPMK